MWRSAQIVAMVCLLGVASESACSSFSGDAPADDAGTDGSSPEADGGGPGDDGSIPNPTPDASVPRYCATVDANLCESFDDTAAGSPLVGYFADGGTFTLVDASVSPPYAARLFNGGMNPALLRATMPAGLANVSCRMQVAGDTSATYAFFGMGKGDGDNFYTVTVTPGSGGPGKLAVTMAALVSKVAALDGGPFFVTKVVGEIPIGVFEPLTITFDAPSKQLTVTIGAASATIDDIQGVTQVSSRPVELGFGPQGDEPPPQAAMRIDDISCTWHE